MQCIQHQFHSLPISSHFQLKNSRTGTKLHWHPTTVPTNFLKTQRTQAMSNSSLVLSLTSSPSPPNITVFLGTSAVLFFMFWIANFVVPEMVIKNLGTEESNGEQISTEDRVLGNKPGAVEKDGFGQNEKP